MPDYYRMSFFFLKPIIDLHTYIYAYVCTFFPWHAQHVTWMCYLSIYQNYDITLQAVLSHLDVIQSPAASTSAPGSGDNLVWGPQAPPTVWSRPPTAECALSEVDKTPQQRGQRSAGWHNQGDQSVISKKLPAQRTISGELWSMTDRHCPFISSEVGSFWSGLFW